MTPFQPSLTKRGKPRHWSCQRTQTFYQYTGNGRYTVWTWHSLNPDYCTQHDVRRGRIVCTTLVATHAVQRDYEAGHIVFITDPKRAHELLAQRSWLAQLRYKWYQYINSPEVKRRKQANFALLVNANPWPRYGKLARERRFTDGTI